jgi:hypothetical protein
LSKIAENWDHNIDPRTICVLLRIKLHANYRTPTAQPIVERLVVFDDVIEAVALNAVDVAAVPAVKTFQKEFFRLAQTVEIGVVYIK